MFRAVYHWGTIEPGIIPFLGAAYNRGTTGCLRQGYPSLTISDWWGSSAGERKTLSLSLEKTSCICVLPLLVSVPGTCTYCTYGGSIWSSGRLRPPICFPSKVVVWWGYKPPEVRSLARIGKVVGAPHIEAKREATREVFGRVARRVSSILLRTAGEADLHMDNSFN